MFGLRVSDTRHRYIRKCETTRSNVTPLAMVQWWSSTSVYVTCPFCKRIHSHGFDGDYSPWGKLRVSHCYNEDFGSQEYRMTFPFSEATGEASYEINRDRRLFVAAGADLSAYFGADETKTLLESFERRLTGKRDCMDATEDITWREFYGGTPDPELLKGEDPDALVKD